MSISPENIISIRTPREQIELAEGERFIDAGLFIEKINDFKRLGRYRKSQIRFITDGSKSERFPFRKQIKKLGKKGLAWAKTRRKLNKIYFENQITRCEKCRTEIALGHAHADKRVDIHSQEQLEETALLCSECHFPLDNEMTHAEMREQVEAIRAERSERYWAAA